MYDQSFCWKTLERVLRKSDFLGVKSASHETFKKNLLEKSIESASGGLAYSLAPLSVFALKGKRVYRFKNLQDEIVGRKICLNLKRISSGMPEGRSQIVRNLSLLLSEGTPYRIYRLDIKSFYESFLHDEMNATVLRQIRLSPLTRSLLENILKAQSLLGGTGVPRGLSLSAPLCDLMMLEFDTAMKNANDVFYYSRYVDDIILITSARESSAPFLRKIKGALPKGLNLNSEKQRIVEILSRVEPLKEGQTPVQISFDYLGYSFSVSRPQGKKSSDLQRKVTVDLAAKKIKKIKTRIVKSFLDFSANKDWDLLCDRVRYLTQNFSVHNAKVGGKKLAGIYHSYPLVTEDAVGLDDLDLFLRNTVLAKNGRSHSMVTGILNPKQRRQLLGYKFSAGHKRKVFVHFSGARISQIQSCWAH